MSFGFQTPEAFVVKEELGLREFNLSAAIGLADIVLKLDVGALFDGVPAITRPMDTNDTVVVPEGFAAEGFALPLPIAFCQPVPEGPGGFLPFNLTRWKSVYYDPSLQVLFNQFPVPSNTPTAASRAWVPAVIVVCVVIALIVAALLIIFFVKPVKNIVMPYNKDKVQTQRAQEQQHFVKEDGEDTSSSDGKTSHRKDSTWKTSAKPSS